MPYVIVIGFLFFIFSFILTWYFKYIFKTYINPSIYYWITIPFTFFGVLYSDYKTNNYLISINYLLSIIGFITSLIYSNVFFSQFIQRKSKIQKDLKNNSYNNLRASYIFLILFSVSIIFTIGAPILSGDVDYARVDIMSDNPALIRVVWYVLPMLYLCLLYLRIKNFGYVCAKKMDYIFLFSLLLPYVLIGNKGQVLSMMILLVVFISLIDEASNYFNKKIILTFGCISLFFLFGIHYINHDTNLMFLLNKIINRLVTIDGISTVFHDYVPNHGLLYGKTFFYEMNGVISKFGLSDPALTQTTGGFISRYVHGYGTEYKFEYVFPLFVQAYLNFGIIGNIILSSVLGFIMYLVIFKLKNSNDIYFVYYFLVLIMLFSIFSSGKVGSF